MINGETTGYNDPRYKTPDIPHIFDQGGGAVMIDFWRPRPSETRLGYWASAKLCYSVAEAIEWLEYHGYAESIWLTESI